MRIIDADGHVLERAALGGLIAPTVHAAAHPVRITAATRFIMIDGKLTPKPVGKVVASSARAIILPPQPQAWSIPSSGSRLWI